MYTSFMKPFYVLITWTLIGNMPVKAQQLDDYINTAFAQNQGLKQQEFDLDRAMFALQEAKTLFMPNVSMLGSYTKAAGGRTIDVPIGDLVNPIYAALNELTASTKYPQLSNQSILLNPDNFYDVKLRTSLPLINAEILYNKRIKQQLISIQQAALNVYKRALVKDIKTAYYRYDQSLQGVETYKSAMQLINENIRVNTSLLKNGVKNGTSLLRAQTEQQKTNAELIAAERNAENARSYFNFLLNRPLQDSIIIDPSSNTDIAAIAPEADTSSGISGREELKQLHALQQVNTLDYKLQQSSFIPKLNTFLDLGSQGSGVTVNSKSRYYLFGVNLQWDLFTAGKRKYRVAQAQSSLNITNSKIDETARALNLHLSQTFNNYRSAKASFASANAGMFFATKYYSDQLKAYKAGQLLYLELVDAQNQLTTAKLNLAAAQAEFQISLAELERDQATYPINNPH